MSIALALLLAVCLSGAHALTSGGGFFRQSVGKLIYERLDPIVQPGRAPSSHAHIVAGASGFAPSFTSASLRKVCGSDGLDANSGRAPVRPPAARATFLPTGALLALQPQLTRQGAHALLRIRQRVVSGRRGRHADVRRRRHSPAALLSCSYYHFPSELTDTFPEDLCGRLEVL